MLTLLNVRAKPCYNMLTGRRTRMTITNPTTKDGEYCQNQKSFCCQHTSPGGMESEW